MFYVCVHRKSEYKRLKNLIPFRSFCFVSFQFIVCARKTHSRTRALANLTFKMQIKPRASAVTFEAFIFDAQKSTYSNAWTRARFKPQFHIYFVLNDYIRNKWLNDKTMEHQHHTKRAVQPKQQQRQQLGKKTNDVCAKAKPGKPKTQINQFENILIEMHYAFICHNSHKASPSTTAGCACVCAQRATIGK